MILKALSCSALLLANETIAKSDRITNDMEKRFREMIRTIDNNFFIIEGDIVNRALALLKGSRCTN